MANYDLVINSQFKPFSYLEMLAPTLQATLAHLELENQYLDLATKASVWEKLANEQTDSNAYKMYKIYTNDLKLLSDRLAKEGLNVTSRRNLLNMKTRYSKEILPIELAYSTRQKLVEDLQKALLLDPTLLLSRDAATTSLDDYINNPQLTYKSQSGKYITTQVALSASALAKELRDDPEKLKKLIGGDYYEYVKKRGFSSEEVLKAILNSEDASPVLTNLVESAIKTSGIKEWKDKNILERAYSSARDGLWQAVGQDDSLLVNNWRAQENLSHAHNMARQLAAQEFQREHSAPREIIGADGKGTGSYYDPKIGKIVNEKGKVIGDQKGVSKSSPDTPINIAGATPKSLSKATKLSAIKSLGLTPVMAIISHRGPDGRAFLWGKEGDDLGNSNNRLLFSETTGNPEFVDPNKPQLGFRTIQGQNALFGSTESAAVDKIGDIKYPESGLEYLPDNAFLNLPYELQVSILQAAKEAGIRDGESYVIYKIKGESSFLFGSDNPEDSYIIFKNNENK